MSMGHEAMAETIRRTVRDVARTESRRPRGEGVVRLEAPSGTAIEEGCGSDGESWVSLRAPDGALLVEYRPGDGVCRIHAPRVEVQAQGELRLAGRTVRIEGEQGVVMQSGTSAVELSPRQVRVLVDDVAVTSKRAVWTTEGFRLVADVVETQARRIVHRADELETRARLLIERTRQSFREVEELAQTKAKRIRFVAEDTFRVLGRRALFKAREDIKMRGKRIYLD